MQALLIEFTLDVSLIFHLNAYVSHVHIYLIVLDVWIIFYFFPLSVRKEKNCKMFTSRSEKIEKHFRGRKYDNVSKIKFRCEVR